MIYPWVLLPILICNCLLNIVISLSHIHKYDELDYHKSSLWYFHFIQSLCTIFTYYCLNKMIWKSLKQNKLFTIENVINFYSKQCLQTTQCLLHCHVMYIDGITKIIMEYIGPDPLPQFSLIKINLQKSIKHLDVTYISRLVTFVVSIYSIIKIYFNSSYDDTNSNIFVILGTMFGVIIFGHMIRRLIIKIFYAIMQYFNFGNNSSSIILALIVFVPSFILYFSENGLYKLDLWVALICDNGLSSNYDVFYPSWLQIYVQWLRFCFAQCGYILMSAIPAFLIRHILTSSYGNAKLL